MKPIDEAVAGKRKALMISGLRGLAKPKPPEPVPDPRPDVGPASQQPKR